MKPLNGGRGPTRSMWTISKRASGVANVPSGVIVCRCTLDRWYCKHDCAHRRTSALMSGHTYRLVTRRSVARTLGSSLGCHSHILGQLTWWALGQCRCLNVWH